MSEKSKDLHFSMKTLRDKDEKSCTTSMKYSHLKEEPNGNSVLWTILQTVWVRVSCVMTKSINNKPFLAAFVGWTAHRTVLWNVLFWRKGWEVSSWGNASDYSTWPQWHFALRPPNIVLPIALNLTFVRLSRNLLHWYYVCYLRVLGWNSRDRWSRVDGHSWTFVMWHLLLCGYG